MKTVEENVSIESVDHLIAHRLPWLAIGILGGILATFVVSKFELILATDIRLTFFIPIIVYLSDAVGTQTETIYVRALSNKKRINFAKYLLKESSIGFGLGTISGALFGIFSLFWLNSLAITITVALTMIINLTFAPVLAVIIPNLLYKEHTDPALGSGPVATIIQDLISLLVYFLIANIFIL